MKFIWLSIMLLMGVVSMGTEKLFTEPPVATIRKSEPAKLDGVLTDAKIRNSAGMYGFCVLRANTDMMKLLPADATFHIGTDGKNILIRVQCPVGPEGILERARAGRGGNRAFMDDSFEFVFVPDPRAKMPSIYHIILNNRGSYLAQGRKGSSNIAWEPDFKFKGNIKDGIWTFEAEFPLASIGIQELKEGQEIGMRVCRNWRRMQKEFGGEWGVQSSWSQIRGAFFESVSIPLVVFRENAPITRFLSLKKDGKPDLRVSLFNPTGTEMKLKTTYLHKPSSSQSIFREDRYTLKPGEIKVISLPTAQVTEEETVSTGFQVASEDGKTVFYRRSFRWSLPSPRLFEQGGSDKERIASKFAFYPESNKLYAVLDFSSLKELSKIRKITAEVLDKKGKILAQTVFPPVKNGITELLWQLPDLKKITSQDNPGGEYQLVLQIQGIEDAKIVKTFERKVFPWEGNAVGKSDRLLPPFTPIQVKGSQVSTILRDHTLSGTGLWKQVKADGENLLKENGITLEAVINGKQYTADGKLTFEKKTPTQVIARSQWNAGALKGNSVSEFDYDGMMKYTLNLEPSAAKVDSLKLLIPLDEKNAYLFHACTDGLRFNYGGATPQGTGRVWDSTKAARMDLQTSYVPYLWLGTEGRGLSVFGDSDKGWVLNSKIPNQEMIRKNGTVYLVYNLIAKPTELRQARQIVLGFQATPVKPMIREWRKSAIWSTPGEAKKYLNYFMSFIGSSLCKGGVSNSDDLSPRDDDVSLWETYGQIRKTRQIPQGYLDRWCAGYKNASPERMKSYRAEINYGLHLMKGAPAGSVTFYTNARGMRTDVPESLTFQDDWFREEFQGTRDRAPAYGASKAYSIDPVESFRDYAVPWYRKMITTGAADNIYWDDIFLASNFDHSGTSGAYRMEDGRYQPHTGLFNMRELIRRTAVMQLELGRNPNNMVHMTNTAITPLLSFAQQNLDWEDNLGTNPFQQRYTKEYIRAVSIGRQFGNLPGALGLVISQGDKQAIEWCLRTGAGVTLTHEILWTKGGAARDYWKVLIAMYQFGYGSDSVRVWNYWEKGYPVAISGDTSSILLSKKGEAILIVCDYAEGGDFTAKLDLKKLGFRKISARNGETGAALNVNGGTLSFQLKKYDFIYIKIKGE